MARRRKEPSVDDVLGSLEARIMEDLWRHGESTVGDVLERLNEESRKQLAYNTVMSVMARLETKGLLERERDGRAFTYWPAMDRDAFFRHQAKLAAAEMDANFGLDAAVAGFAEHLRDAGKSLDDLERIIREGDS